MDDAHSNVDYRLPAIRMRDIILAALQAAFAAPNLLGDNETNRFLFNRNDPQASRVWISSEEGRVGYSERDGKRNIITVSRGDYVPSEQHLHNLAGMRFSDGQMEYSDLASCQIYVNCDAGNETESEVLASICYHVLKLFRQQIMKDYDVHNLRLIGIMPPIPHQEVPGQPWRTVVSLQVSLQEHARMIQVANALNHLDITSHLSEEMEARVITLDATDVAADS